MPWKLQKVGGRYFVVDDDGKRYSEKPMSRARATRQMQALYASEQKVALTKNGLPASAFLVVEDLEKVTTWHLPVKDSAGRPDHRLMGAAWAALHGGYRGNTYDGPGKQDAISKLRALYEDEEMAVPGEKGSHSDFSVFKQADGLYRWVAVSSSAFKDRDGEFVTEQALSDDVVRCDESKDYGPLRWWHLGGWEAPDGVENWQTWKAGPGIDIGTCDFNMMHGRLLIESGTFKTPEIGEAFAQVTDPLEISIGFSHPRNEPNADGEYRNIHRFERSLLPPGMASNLLTRYYVTKGDSGMKTQAKLAALVAILRGKPEVAAKILDDAAAVQKAAEDAGLEFKDIEDVLSGDDSIEPVKEKQDDMVEPAASEQPTEEPESEPDEIGAMSHDDLKKFIVDTVNELMAASVQKQVMVEGRLEELIASIQDLASKVTAAKESADKSQQTLLELTDARPVGIKQLQSQRPTESAGNVTSLAPVGPHLDDSFVNFARGGK